MTSEMLRRRLSRAEVPRSLRALTRHGLFWLIGMGLVIQSLSLYPYYAINTDRNYRESGPHCKVGLGTVLRLHSPDGARASVMPLGTGCVISPTTDSETWLAEDGTPVSMGETSAATGTRTVLGGEWVERPTSNLRPLMLFIPLLIFLSSFAFATVLAVQGPRVFFPDSSRRTSSRPSQAGRRD